MGLERGIIKAGLMLGVNPNAIRQADDFYATSPSALEVFLTKLKNDKVSLNNFVWEPACGEGHLSDVLIQNGYSVYSSDLIDRGYGKVRDFLVDDYNLPNNGDFDILTNPPFKVADKFVEQSMSLLKDGNNLLLFLKVQFLESQSRKKLFELYPPKYIYYYSKRQKCARDAEFDKYTATTQFYIWVVWQKGFSGETISRWI